MVKVCDYACLTVTDLPLDPAVDLPVLDGHVNRCIAAVDDALRLPAGPFTENQREHLRHICKSMRTSHTTIQTLLAGRHDNPQSVDALPIARLQLETLYAICLVLESPPHLDLYFKHSWKQTYVLHLLMTTECRNLPIQSAVLNSQLGPLEEMRKAAGVSREEEQTIRSEHLDEPAPAGGAKRIQAFPTPGATLKLVKDQDRKRMLSRLYFEYQFLCSFVHFSSQSRSFKGIFDAREPFGAMFSAGEVERMFQKEIEGPAVWIDYLSIVQSCAEVLTLYPADLELRRCVAAAWSVLEQNTLMGRAVWESRAKKLIGVI